MLKRDRRIQLKIKVKSLAEEAKIIRHEVKRLSKIQGYCDTASQCGKIQNLGIIKHDLNEHRKGIIRYEARHALLAYAIFNETPYEKVESNCKEAPDLKKVADTARRFGASQENIEVWIAEAKKYLKK